MVFLLIRKLNIFIFFQGFSHSKGYQLFSIGAIAGEGVKQFVETGDSDKLDREAATNNFFDSFIAPPITSGTGNTSTTIFVDGNNTKVNHIQNLQIRSIIIVFV